MEFPPECRARAQRVSARAHASGNLPHVMATLNTVARIMESLPETEETSSATGLRWWVVKRKTIAWERPLRKSDLQALGARAPRGTILGVWLPDMMMKASLLSANPDVFF